MYNPMSYILKIFFYYNKDNAVSYHESCNLLIKGLPVLQTENEVFFEKMIAYIVLRRYVNTQRVVDFVLPEFAQLDVALNYSLPTQRQRAIDSFKNRTVQDVCNVLSSIKGLNPDSIDFTQISVDIESIASSPIALQVVQFDSVEVICHLSPAEEVAFQVVQFDEEVAQ